MTSTNDGKDVKSNSTSGPKGKTYYIELYKSLDSRLTGECNLHERTRHLCEAWRHVHSLCQHSAQTTHPHLLSWLQRHTARTILQTEWQSPKTKDDQTNLDGAINDFIEECKSAVVIRNGVSPPWEKQLQQRAEWFKRILEKPWGHPVLRVLLDPRGQRLTDDEILKWLKEERGVMFVTRLRQLATSKCDDLAMALVTAVMDRARSALLLVPDNEQAEEPKENTANPKEEPTFADILKTEAGFTVEVWELLTDIEFVLLHKGDRVSKCIELAKQTPLRNGYQLVERLQARLETSPREKKLWKNAKEVAILIAQVVIARCMLVPVCAGGARTALYCCARALARLLPASRLPAAAASLAAPAGTARHLHTLAAAVDAQCSSDMKPFVCELYVRAITAGMNELERFKLKTEKESDARSTEQTLCAWFNQLGLLLSASDRIKCECTLTAFSVHPSPDMYEKIKTAPALPAVSVPDDQELKQETTSEFGSWATDSRTQTNLVKTSETLNIKHTQNQANVLSTAIFAEGEALGLSPEICQDIAVLLSGPRVKTLSWDMNRELLLENCRTYMERTHGGTRALTTELKYLNLDPSSYEHLPIEEDDENDVYYGIEKGYEHLVELQEPEDIWETTLFDAEATESACSSSCESEFLKVPRKKKIKKLLISSDDESDPLSIVAETKKSDKKKERYFSKDKHPSKDISLNIDQPLSIIDTPPSKDKPPNIDRTLSKERPLVKERTIKNRSIAKERSKERKKKTKSTEDSSQNKVRSCERRKDEREEKNDRALALEKKKEKKARKKKSKEEKQSVLAESKPGSLSSLIGMKVAKIKIPEGKYKKSTETKATPCNTDSDYDSQGKSSLASLNSEGTESDVLFDGLFSMDDYKSPDKNDPLADRYCFSNSELSFSNGQVHTSRMQNKQDVDKSNIINIPQYRPPSATSSIASSTYRDFKTDDKIREDVKKSISKLLEFRRQKNLLEEAQKALLSPSTPKTTIHKTADSVIRQQFSQPTKISPMAVKDHDIPKVYVNKHQIEQLNELKTEVDNYLKSKFSPKPVIQFASKQNVNTSALPNDYEQLSSSQETYLPQPYQQINFGQSYSQQSPLASHVIQTPKTPALDTYSQKNLQDFVRELHETINAGTGKGIKKTTKLKTNQSTKTEMKPMSRVTPIIPNSMNKEALSQSAKILQGRRMETQLNTFARLSYMHKNKQSTEALNSQCDQYNNTLSRFTDEQRTVKLKHLQAKGEVVITKTNNTMQISANNENKHNPVRKTEKPSAVYGTNLLRNEQGVIPKRITPSNDILKNVSLKTNKTTEVSKSYLKNSSLSERDQNDLLLLLRQQNKLNTQPKTTPITTDVFNINKIKNNPQCTMAKYPAYNSITTKSTSSTSNSTVIKNPIEVYSDYSNGKKNFEGNNVKTVSELPQTDVYRKTVDCKTSKVKTISSKGVNMTQVAVNTQLEGESILKQHLTPNSSSQTIDTRQQDWEKVMDAILSHKTPCRGPNALQMTLKKNKTHSDLRNQRIVRPNTLSKTINSKTSSNLEKPINQELKSSTVLIQHENRTADIEKKHQCNNPTEALKKPISVSIHETHKQPQSTNKPIEKLQPNLSRSTLYFQQPDLFIKKQASRQEVEQKSCALQQSVRKEASVQPQVLKTTIPDKLAVDDNHKKRSIKCLKLEKDPFISGIPNSDYDLLDELMDDELRKEIGEISSDEDSYNASNVSGVKGVKIISSNNKSNNVIKDTLSTKEKLRTISGGNLHQSCRDTIIKCNETPILKCNKTSTENKESTSNPTLINVIKSKQNSTTCKAVPKMEASNSATVSTNASHPVGTNVTSNKVNEQPHRIIASNSINMCEASNVIIAGITQPSLQNVVLIGSDLVLDPYVSIQTQTTQLQSGLSNVNQPQYMSYSNVPNITMYQSTQFAAPVVNPVIIGNAITMPMPNLPTVPSKIVEMTSTSCNTEVNQKISDHETHTKSNADKDNKVHEIRLTTVTDTCSPYQLKQGLKKQEIKTSDINSNKICERKLLSEVQERQKFVEKLDTVNGKTNQLVLYHHIKETQKEVFENVINDVKNLKENVLQKDNSFNLERLRNKRLALINREINHSSTQPPIPLKYIPLTCNNLNTTPTENINFFGSITKRNFNEIHGNTSNEDTCDTNKSKENNIDTTQSTRIVLHSSELKSSALPTTYTTKTDTIRKIKIRLKGPVESETLTVEREIIRSKDTNNQDVRGLSKRVSQKILKNQTKPKKKQSVNVKVSTKKGGKHKKNKKINCKNIEFIDTSASSITKYHMTDKDVLSSSKLPEIVNVKDAEIISDKIINSKHDIKSESILMQSDKIIKVVDPLPLETAKPKNKIYLNSELKAVDVMKPKQIKNDQSILLEKAVQILNIGKEDISAKIVNKSEDIPANIVNMNMVPSESVSIKSMTDEISVENISEQADKCNSVANKVNQNANIEKCVPIDVIKNLDSNNVEESPTIDKVVGQKTVNNAEVKHDHDNLSHNYNKPTVQNHNKQLQNSLPLKEKPHCNEESNYKPTNAIQKTKSVKPIDANKSTFNHIKNNESNIEKEIDLKSLEKEVTVEELPPLDHEPNKKRLRIVLPNGKVFKATVIGQMCVSFQSLFSEPSMKRVLMNNLINDKYDSKRYTLNIKQVSTMTKHNPNKIYESRIEEINFQDKPEIVDTIDLLSDEEERNDTVRRKSFITEFGIYKVTMIDTKLFELHQRKLDQKCVVILNNINYLNDTKTKSVTENTPEKDVPVKNAPLFEESSCELGPIIDAMVLDDTQLPTSETNIVLDMPPSLQRDIESAPLKSNYENEVIEIDDSSSDSINLLKDCSLMHTYIEPALSNYTIGHYTSKKSIPPDNNNEPQEKINELRSLLLEDLGVKDIENEKQQYLINNPTVEKEKVDNMFHIRKCFVKLSKCDHLVKKYEQLKIINRKCTVDLFRCDNMSKSINENVNDEIIPDCDSDELIDIDVQDENTQSPSVLSRCNSFSLLNNFSFYTEDETPFDSFSIDTIYDERTSPVMEVYETIVAIKNFSSVSDPPKKLDFSYFKCYSEWFKTKHELRIEDIAMNINNDPIASKHSVEKSPCGILITNPIPSLKKLTAKLFKNDSLLDLYLFIKRKLIQSPPHTLKRKIKSNENKNIKSKCLKLVVTKPNLKTTTGKSKSYNSSNSRDKEKKNDNSNNTIGDNWDKLCSTSDAMTTIDDLVHTTRAQKEEVLMIEESKEYNKRRKNAMLIEFNDSYKNNTDHVGENNEPLNSTYDHDTIALNKKDTYKYTGSGNNSIVNANASNVIVQSVDIQYLAAYPRSRKENINENLGTYDSENIRNLMSDTNNEKHLVHGESNILIHNTPNLTTNNSNDDLTVNRIASVAPLNLIIFNDNGSSNVRSDTECLVKDQCLGNTDSDLKIENPETVRNDLEITISGNKQNISEIFRSNELSNNIIDNCDDNPECSVNKMLETRLINESMNFDENIIEIEIDGRRLTTENDKDNEIHLNYQHSSLSENSILQIEDDEHSDSCTKQGYNHTLNILRSSVFDHIYVLKNESIIYENINENPNTEHENNSNEYLEKSIDVDDIMHNERIKKSMQESLKSASRKEVTLLYKDSTDITLKGIEFEDPIVGTCYVFPINDDTDDNDDGEVVQVVELSDESDHLDDIEEMVLEVNVPKITYSRLTNPKIKELRLNTLKRKRGMNDVKILGKKYRKGKNIDYPKLIFTASNNTTYCKEYKTLLEYCTSLKFSFSQPFHKEFIDVDNILKNWPITDSCSNIVQNDIDNDNILFEDHKNAVVTITPLDLSFIDEINVPYDELEQLTDNVSESNFNMGFGDGSGRVIQNFEDTDGVSKFSAATLSDVKQPQPFLLSEDFEGYKNITDDDVEQVKQDQVNKLKQYITYIQLRDKVRSFFNKTTIELSCEWMKQNGKNDSCNSQHSKNYFANFPFDLCQSDFIEPPPIETIVQVVQVGQLPVNAAAQNPVTCDPRVTQVSDASPSQCSVDNSPQDDSQVTIKTEYTELTTADLTLPLVQEYTQHNQGVTIESQDSSQLGGNNENIPIETEIKSVVKIELMEELPEVKEELREHFDNNDYEPTENKNPHNAEYSFEPNNATIPISNNPTILRSDTDFQTIFNSSEKQGDDETYTPQKQQNGASEKTDQIAHAMNAAGITTSAETITNTTRAHALVNILSQKLRQGTIGTAQSISNSFSKTTAINALALQQALAQILPPPLNQTNSSENNQQAPNTQVSPQVLHIVQGKNASGSQITLVDNSQQSVINNQNATPVLHIVQNKTGSSGTTSNGTATPQTNSFSGLSLVDTGLQQGGNQLLHIVNTGSQKNNNATSQLLKRVNLLTNLTNVQGTNEQKMVQFVCKSADGKAIQLNAPHQRSMVLRLQPIESPNVNVQTTPPKTVENQDINPQVNTRNSSPSKDNTGSQQEIKSRSVYEENYAKFIQNSSNKSTISEKSTSLPKFNQAFGKPVFQDGNQKSNEITVNNSSESNECQAAENTVNLDHIGQINSPPLLLRKSPAQTSQPPTNLVQQLKQNIAPMNIQTMHGGVIYTRQIPVNIGGGQTINLITVPSTELIDDSGQNKQPGGNQNEIEQSIIKIVPQNQTTSTTDMSSEDSSASISASNENTPNPQPQPVLTQMRIKLPMLSKAPQMVSGGRVVRPSFFQIQRNVIGGNNQPVYQQLVLTAAPPLGQQTIRLPQTQTSRQIKVPAENQSTAESQMSTSTLEQLREFDMVLEQVKERSTVQPSSSTNSTFPKLHTPSSDTTDSATAASSTSTETTQQVLYSIGNNQPLNVAYVSRKATATTPTTSTFARSPDSSGIVDSPTSSTHSQIPHTITSETTQNEPPTQSKTVKSKSKSRPKASSNPPNNLKLNTVPPKSSAQKPLEDEQTTQRILYILAEYKEQVENSPDKDKPAPRRRTNPPSNPGSSKRKKSSSGCRRPCGRDLSPIHGEDTCRTMGSEDSSCGTSQGDCNESCLETHSPQDSPRKVVRKLTFEQETPTPQPRPQPQRNVIVADGQTITVARGTAGKPTTAVLMPANYILPVSMVKGGQQIAIVTNRGPKLLTVGGSEGGATNALLLQRLIGPAGLKPMLARPGVRHVRLPTAALHNLQAFNLATTTTIQPPDSTASSAQGPTPPELIDTRATSSPWTDREAQDVKPERASSPEGSEPWHLTSSGDPQDYSYEETVRADNLDRTVLDPIPDRYSPDMEAQRIFDKMFDVESKKSYMGDSHDDSPRCAYDIDASDCDDKAYHQVVQKKDGSTHRQHRLTHVSAAALRHKYAILEHELRLQKSLSEECEDLGVDSPSASELFPEAELLFAASPAHDHTQDQIHHLQTSQPSLLSQSSIPQPDIDDQIATDQLLSRDMSDDQQDLNLGLEDVGIVTVSEDGMQATIALDQEEFARSHPNTTFHSEPTDEGEVQPFTITGLKSRHITSTIFHSNRVPATVLMTAPQTTVISQATPESSGQNPVKYSDIDNMINSLPSGNNNINLSSVLVKDDGLTRFDNILNDSRELHLSNTASAIIHSSGNATQVIRRVCYDDDKRDTRFLMDEPEPLIAGDDAKMIAEDSSRDATLESMAGDVDDDRSSPERHAELFWESNSASERSESRRPMDFSSDSEKCCKSPSYDETNSTDSSGVGTHMRLDSVIKEARGIERSGSADGSSADDTHPPLRTYPPKRSYHPLDGDVERSLSGKTRAGERSPDSLEVRRRASGRGVVKRGCHCCNGSPAPPRPKKSRQRKPTMDFTTN